MVRSYEERSSSLVLVEMQFEVRPVAITPRSNNNSRIISTLPLHHYKSCPLLIFLILGCFIAFSPTLLFLALSFSLTLSISFHLARSLLRTYLTWGVNGSTEHQVKRSKIKSTPSREIQTDRCTIFVTSIFS